MNDGKDRSHPVIRAALRLTADVELDPFAADGMRQVHRYIGAFIDDLLLQSVTVMRRHDAAQVTAAYVDIAMRSMRSRRRTFGRVVRDMLIGLFLGLLSSGLWDIYEHGAPVEVWRLIMIVLFVALGTFLAVEQQWRS